MAENFTVPDFLKQFPDNDTCLEHVMDVRCGKRHECRGCGQVVTFHRLANRKA